MADSLRQQRCWAFYVNPESETFANAYQSARKAGYEAQYSEVITLQPWFKAQLARLNLLEKAEKKLEEALDLPVKTGDGTTDKGVIDVAKFVASTQGKHVGYSTRQELTGADGAPLITNESKEKADHVLDQFLNQDQGNTGVE